MDCRSQPASSVDGMPLLEPSGSPPEARDLESLSGQQSFQTPAARSGPGWLKSGLFSGEGSHASPIDAVLSHKKKQEDGSFLVDVELEPVEAVHDFGHGRRSFYGGYAWQVVARVISDTGQYMVDDVRIFDRFPAEGPSHLLSDSFTGCDGSRWTGLNAANK